MIKKILRITLKIVNVLVVIGAIGVLVYFFGYKQLEQNLLQKGFNIAVNQIVQQVQQTGSVQLGDIILIKK